MQCVQISQNSTSRNNGIRAQRAFAHYCGIEQHAHDAIRYDIGSDIEIAGHGYSVKSSGATLMAGMLCEGRESFESIWELYAERVHSDRFVYVTNAWTAYVMNLSEFSEFVHAFGRCERESSKNGGAVKIRFRKESSKMVAWLKDRAT